MPVTLPGGLTLMLTGHAPLDPGQNRFECPPGHFWVRTRKSLNKTFPSRRIIGLGAEASEVRRI
jgi:hypothetical protein